MELKYEVARPLISDGDVVFIRNGSSIWSTLTEVVTRSPYYHVGFAFWFRDPNYQSRLMFLEASRGGRRIVSMSTYSDHDMDVYLAPRPWLEFADEAMDLTGRETYSIADYLSIGLRETWNINMKNFRGQVCSEMVATYLQRELRLNSTLLSPSKLARELDYCGFTKRYEIRL